MLEQVVVPASHTWRVIDPLPLVFVSYVYDPVLATVATVVPFLFTLTCEEVAPLHVRLADQKPLTLKPVALRLIGSSLGGGGGGGSGSPPLLSLIDFVADVTFPAASVTVSRTESALLRVRGEADPEAVVPLTVVVDVTTTELPFIRSTRTEARPWLSETLQLTCASVHGPPERLVTLNTSIDGATSSAGGGGGGGGVVVSDINEYSRWLLAVNELVTIPWVAPPTMASRTWDAEAVGLACK